MHQGSHTECLYKLMTFGIPVAHFPVTENMQLKREYHQRWIRSAHRMEESDEMAVLIPSLSDILFGRGRPIQQHPGNLHLNVILGSLYEKYESLSRNEKTNFAARLVEEIRSSGSRFLKQRHEGMIVWEEVDDDRAREKISHTFRSLRSEEQKRRRSEKEARNRDEEDTTSSNGGEKRSRQG